ncbi:methyltransferase domain-containing protein [Parashewanella curva]|uniref:Methyltransferase domain-containing protein n=2 Tax=Parashewanella curva TaxID=2338552 RepID=A0A3L8PX67_9GAMM|nr:methyltransferase domain-containing protein [Parashewanella curva]
MGNVRLRYQTLEFAVTDLHICSLRDSNQYSDPDGIAEAAGISPALWPLFGVLWPSGIILAEYVQDFDFENKRILEVGCGIGVSSLLLNKLNANITASDYHPAAQTFIERNNKLNHHTPIKFERINWENDHEGLGQFDLIIGSDLLYEDHQVKTLSQFLLKHTKPQGEMILVDPGRGRKSRLCKQIEQAGFECAIEQPKQSQLSDFKGHIMYFNRL